METGVSTGRPLIILNPAANCGNMQMYRALIRRRLEEEEADYVETGGPGEATMLARQAAEAGCPVIIVGGDGSVNEVINGLLAVGRQVPLGIVAAGSGNDFAWSALKLAKDPETALERALHGQPVAVDAGIANGRYFSNSFSVGLDADIAAAADAMKKVPLLSGKRLYYASILRQLCFGYHRCPWLKFQIDDGVAVRSIAEKRYVLIAITNGPSYGAGFYINPAADICDGLLNVCTIDYTPLLRALTLLPTAQKGKHAGLPEVAFYTAKSVSIESRSTVNSEVDGEIVQATSFIVKLLPGALWVRV